MEKKERLIKYIKMITTVPSKFVDSFFKFYTDETTQTDFVINLDAVASWLSCNRYELTRTLRAVYKIHVDYEIIQTTSVKKYANNVKKYMITPDCFKRLCMLSRSKNAEQVRTYFIEIESLMIKYRTQLISGIQQDIETMRRNKKLKTEVQQNPDGYIYIIRASKDFHDNTYKIGRSKDLIKRLQTYQTGKLEDIDLLFVYKTNDSKAVEACVKAFANNNRVYDKREIYHLNLDMLKTIISGCGKLSIKLEHRSKGATKTDGQYYAIIGKDT